MPIYFLTPPPHPNDILTIADTTDIARVVDKTVRRWIESGQLPAKQLTNRQWAIRRGDLEVFLNTRLGA